MALVVVAAALGGSSGARGALPPRIEDALVGKWAETPNGFRIIALSHIADGCAAEDDPAVRDACLDGAVAQAKKLERNVNGTASTSALFFTHEALILGASHARTSGCADPRRHEELVRALVQASLADPFGIAPSYAGKKERWPADQAATLAAIARFDRGHGTTLVAEPLSRYRTALDDKATDADSHLPWSEVALASTSTKGAQGTGRMPRGCALSYSIRYLAEVDPLLARRYWDAYVDRYLVDAALLVGFREWPPGVDRKGDVDSGPIVSGVGAAASAFGIAAARAMGASGLALRLEGTAALVGAAARANKDMRRHADSSLADAIRFAASRQRTLAPAVTPTAPAPTAAPAPQQ